jgi:hypothetical protein
VVRDRGLERRPHDAHDLQPLALDLLRGEGARVRVGAPEVDRREVLRSVTASRAAWMSSVCVTETA